MRPLKGFLLITACVLWLLATSTAHALILSEGESLILVYDFSSLSPQPPYNDFHFESPLDSLEVLAADPHSASFGSIAFYDLSDPFGSYFAGIYYPSRSPGDVAGGASVGGPISPPTTSSTFYGLVFAEVGDWQISEFPLLSMSVDGVETPAVSGSPAPEPATLLLIGTGLVGLVGLRRMRRFTLMVMAIVVMLFCAYTPPAGALVIYDFAGYEGTPNGSPPLGTGVLTLTDDYAADTHWSPANVFVSFAYENTAGENYYTTQLANDYFYAYFQTTSGPAEVNLNFPGIYTDVVTTVSGYWDVRHGTPIEDDGNHPLWTLRAAPAPEPAALLLLGSGLVGLVGLRRKFKA